MKICTYIVVKTKRIVRFTPMAASKESSLKQLVECPMIFAIMDGSAVVIIKPSIFRMKTIRP